MLADGAVLRAGRCRPRSRRWSPTLRASGRRLGRDLPDQRLPQSAPTSRRSPRCCAPRRPELYLSLSSIGRAADPRISARLDHRDQRLHHADHRALSARPGRAAWQKASVAEPAADHAELSGGVIGAEVAGRNPVRMIESGPAAGALAAAYYAERLGLDRLLSFDMGGTTAKACLIEDRKPLVTGSFEVDRNYRFCEGSGMPLTIPSIDMIEIGAGGGSIAYVDDLGLLKVGPQQRRLGAGPGLLRPRRDRADRHRRRPGAGPARRRQLPRRRHAAGQAGGRSGDRPAGRRRSAPAARRPPAASTASSPKPWPRPRAPTPPIAASTIAACRCWPSAARGRCTPARWDGQSMSIVRVAHIDCTTTGFPPPTLIAPISTARVLRAEAAC